ncbi:conserved hypothetical protein [Streptomyces clavuligerus]|nr:conserved hypothetical protein [Streptomyces clavuligerus]
MDPGRYTGPGPRGNDGPLEIGRVREGTTAYPFKGTVGEVRIWGKARENNQLGTALQPRDDGLIARWTFEENEGNTTADLAGGYGLKLRGARWTADPDPKASSFTLHRNGEAIPTDTPTTSPLTEWSQEQLTLGALKTSATDFGEFFHGALEEVRLWRTARTPEQLLDSLFTRLKGDKQDLIGYWPFDSASTTPTSEAVRDHSLRGNHLDLGDETNRPAIVLSTAPVSTDTAAVRSALAGVRTRFHQSATAGPAASEYADLQYTPTGEATGVLKRAYAHITNGTWHLTTGYKVGDLVSEWVSQVQFDPQLIGYIEGAPPVPSENLTGGTDPAGCAKVTFQEADEVTSALSSSSERSVDTSFSVTAANEVDQDTLLILAPLGFGVASPLFEVGLLGSLGGSLEFSNAWTSETSVSQGTSTQRDTTATLTGAWEDDTQQLNDAIGRRWVPNNHGYALVQSETADVYALRLAHTGALVAYRMMPNPDIPKDWNIISFPINPQYTKQGTLDGAVGFDDRGKVLDPAYANATGRGDHSYFKPREAYALKRGVRAQAPHPARAPAAGELLPERLHRHRPQRPHRRTRRKAPGVLRRPRPLPGRQAAHRHRRLLRQPQHRQHLRLDRRRRLLRRNHLDHRRRHPDHRRLLHPHRKSHRHPRSRLRSRRRRHRPPVRSQPRRRPDRHPQPHQGIHPHPQPRSRVQPHPRPAEIHRRQTRLQRQQARPGPRQGRRLPLHDLLPRPGHHPLRRLLQQSRRPHLARRQQRPRRHRPEAGPAQHPQTPLLADPAPRHLPLPHPPRHPHRRRTPAGESPPRRRRHQQLRTHPPPRPLRLHRHHRPGRPRRRHPHRPRHPPPRTPAPRT